MERFTEMYNFVFDLKQFTFSVCLIALLRNAKFNILNYILT